VIGGSTLAYGSPSFFPDGKSILAGSGNDLAQLTQLEKISLADGSSMNVTNMLGTATTGIMSRVVVSPDGTKAAFDARIGSSGARIFVIDLTSKAVNQVTDYPGEPQANDASPCWLGNDKVCFSSDTGGGEQVYALPASGMMTSGGLQLAGATEPWFGPNSR
jgi:Tol biopolymer transport system component